MVYALIVAIVLNIFAAGILIKKYPSYILVETEGVYPLKNILIYSGVMLALNVGIIVFVSLFYTENLLLFNIRMICIMSLLWPVAIIDYKSNRIPNIVIIVGLLYRIIIFGLQLLFENEGVWWGLATDVIAAVAICGIMLLATLAVKNGIGFGDIKLLAVMCLLLGMSGVWPAIFCSLIIAFVWTMILLLTKKKSKKDLMPFAPAIMIGTYVSIFLTGM